MSYCTIEESRYRYDGSRSRSDVSARRTALQKSTLDFFSRESFLLASRSSRETIAASCRKAAPAVVSAMLWQTLHPAYSTPFSFSAASSGASRPLLRRTRRTARTRIPNCAPGITRANQSRTTCGGRGRKAFCGRSGWPGRLGEKFGAERRGDWLSELQAVGRPGIAELDGRPTYYTVLCDGTVTIRYDDDSSRASDHHDTGATAEDSPLRLDGRHCCRHSDRRLLWRRTQDSVRNPAGMFSCCVPSPSQISY